MRARIERIAGLPWLALGAAALWSAGLGLWHEGVRERLTSSPLAATLPPAGALALGALLGRWPGWSLARRHRRRLAQRGRARALLRPLPLLVLAVAALATFGLPPLARDAGELELARRVVLGLGAALCVASLAYLLLPRRALVPAASPARKDGPIGLLLVHGGAPHAPSARELRRFRRRILGDPRLVGRRRALLARLLRWSGSPLHAARLARRYRALWTPRGAPLVDGAHAQAEALARALGPGWRVAVAMRRGRPDVGEALDALLAAGCRELRVQPVLAQPSAATWGADCAAVFRRLARRRTPPPLAVLPPLGRDPEWTRAHARAARAAEGGARVDHWVFSFESVPPRALERGDPYARACQEGARALARELGLSSERWSLGFHGGLAGPQWLEPASAELLTGLARERRRVGLVFPGLALESFEHLDVAARTWVELFARAGGGALVLARAPGLEPEWLDALARRVRAAGGESAAPASSSPAPAASPSHPPRALAGAVSTR